MQFHHHPDNLIILRGDDDIYIVDLQTFAEDCSVLGLPAYGGLPDNMRERRYTNNGGSLTHTVHTADSQFAGVLPWPQGETYLDHLAAFITRQQMRVEAAQSVKAPVPG